MPETGQRRAKSRAKTAPQRTKHQGQSRANTWHHSGPKQGQYMATAKTGHSASNTGPQWHHSGQSRPNAWPTKGQNMCFHRTITGPKRHHSGPNQGQRKAKIQQCAADKNRAKKVPLGAAINKTSFPQNRLRGRGFCPGWVIPLP